MELDGNRFIHFKDHIKADKDSRNIPLTNEEMLNLTDYIDNYSEILDCTHKKDGGVRLYISYEDSDGVIVIVELISKGRYSLQPVTAWKNTKEAFHLIWDQKKKAPTTSRAAHKSASSGYISTFNNIIPQTTQNSNTSENNNLNGPRSKDDTIYLSALERGDMETAQRMVDEAAERAFKDSILYIAPNKKKNQQIAFP